MATKFPCIQKGILVLPARKDQQGLQLTEAAAKMATIKPAFAILESPLRSVWPVSAVCPTLYFPLPQTPYLSYIKPQTFPTLSSPPSPQVVLRSNAVNKQCATGVFQA